MSSTPRPSDAELIRMAREDPEEFGKWFAEAPIAATQEFANRHGDATATRRDRRKQGK